MATLFDPLSVALETVKTIEGVGSHKPDPPRFKVRVPINPGEWALKEAFQRQHDLTKWSKYNAKSVQRTEKKGLKLPKITSTGSTAESTPSEGLLAETPSMEVKVVKIASDVDAGSSSSKEQDDEDEEFDAYNTFEDEEDEETQKMTKMSQNQRRYIKACSVLLVTVNRKVLRHIDHYELVLSMMKMSDPEFKAIMTSLVMNDTVERLDITEMRLTDQQVVYLTDFFSEENAVTDLILAENNLKGRILQNLFAVMSAKDSLVYLDISGNDLRDKDAIMLADYIKTSENLTHLHMSRNNFTDKSGEVFGKMIGENQSIIELDISSNRLRCTGAEKFFKGFLKNSTVQRLNFSWNGLGIEGTKAVVNMLKKNASVVYMNLSGSRISGADLELFYPSLKKNMALQRIVLSHNPLLMSDITGFLKELYKWTTSGLQRIDFGTYQTVEKAAMPLIDLLFWEKNVDIRYGGTLTHSKESYKSEEIITKFRDDPLALVTRLKPDERMKLVKYFGQIDLNTAIEEGEEEISSESFLFKVRNNKVTYRDLANRVKKAGSHPFDVIRDILEVADIVMANGRPIPRYSLNPDIARRIYIKLRANDKLA